MWCTSSLLTSFCVVGLYVLLMLFDIQLSYLFACNLETDILSVLVLGICLCRPTNVQLKQLATCINYAKNKQLCVVHSAYIVTFLPTFWHYPGLASG